MTELRLVLAGAAIGNGNRGIEALALSVTHAVEKGAPGGLLTVLDDGWGVRQHRASACVELAGVRLSRRWHRPESWAQIRLAQALGARGNAVARRIAAADAVLDLSGGDSFTDIYGPTRLDSVCAPKEAALRAGRPLVLLPQTYGPFTGTAARDRAQHLVRSATVAYSRDGWSHDRLLELAGPDADPTRLRAGVDVAFALPPRQPDPSVVDTLDRLTGRVLAGVNVSGLLRDAGGQGRFGIAGDYLTTMTDLVRALLRTGAHVVLVSHVHADGGRGESDVNAARRVQEALTAPERAATTLLPPSLGAAELKWVIGRLDWFVGTRMHATIAALSSAVPAFGYAYSDKTHGVFATCGMATEVADARSVTGPAAVQLMLDSFGRRERTGADLARSAPGVNARARDQLADLLTEIGQWHGTPQPIGAPA